MSKKIIKENELNIMYHHTGMSTRGGCQCFKDCSCYEDFKPAPYDYYTVKRKNKKTTFHQTLEGALERWEFVLTLT